MPVMRRCLFGVVGAIATYLLTALTLGLLPVNADFREPAEGITIFLRSNGVHVDLALPVRSAVADLSTAFPARHFGGPVEALGYIGFGWGDRDFYLHTQTWADVRLAGAVSALLGLKPTVLHVQYMEPRLFAGERIAIVVTAAQYARLVAYIQATLKRDEHSQPVAIAKAGYGADDAFFEANGSYSLISTCNEWIRRGLSVAGIRTARWSPFDAALRYQLRSKTGGDVSRL
jgi:uncharacterized protein (TIGR02117 family)